MKNLFYKLYCLLFLNLWGQLILGVFLFIAGLVGGSDPQGWFGPLFFIGIVAIGSFVLWGYGQQNNWKAKWLKDKYGVNK